jgi:hypothetical protein
VVDSLCITANTDIYITGSNANRLSSELATMLSGRYVEIRMLPLSFREFAQAHTETAKRQSLYREYVSTSSFPYAMELSGAARELDSYLEGIYNTILVKDVMTRRRIQDPMVLNSVAKFVFSSIGSELSVKRIADTLTSGGGVVVVPDTVPQSLHPTPPAGMVGVGVGVGRCSTTGVSQIPEFVTAMSVPPLPKRFCVTITTVSGVTSTVAVGARVWKGRFPPEV